MNSYVAFHQFQLLASGDLPTVIRSVKAFLDRQGPAEGTGQAPGLLVFDLGTGRQVDFDLRGSADEAIARLGIEPEGERKAAKGRPRLGVVAGEVTLLPRHWDWLARQPNRASGTLRRLVEEAMAREATDPKRRAEVLGTLLWSLAGNLEGFEEATRSLFRLDFPGLFARTDTWPGDLPRFVRDWLGARSGDL